MRAYYLWGPFSGTDGVDAADAGAQRYAAPNAVHFWTSTRLLAEQLAEILRLPRGRAAWDVFLLYNRGVIWDQQIPSPDYWQQDLDLLQGDKFDLQKLERQIRQALISK